MKKAPDFGAKLPWDPSPKIPLVSLGFQTLLLRQLRSFGQKTFVAVSLSTRRLYYSLVAHLEIKLEKEREVFFSTEFEG